MSEKTDLRILLACSRPLVLKAQRWMATLDEEARPHLKAAADKLKEAAELANIEARGKILIFDLYPPAPNSDFLRNVLKSVIPLKDLNGDSAPEPIDVLRPGEEIEVVRRCLERIRREIQVVVHGAATLPEINQELLYTEPGFDVLHFIGHGGQAGVLYFEDGSGGARRVKTDELARLVRGRVVLLVTMACFSERIVEKLFPEDDEPVVPAAVCIDGGHPIEARAAELFSGALYSGLAQGRTLKRSFDDALEAVRMDDVVGERATPDMDDKPTPWRRFILKGDGWIDAAEDVARYALARYERTTERYTMLHPVMEYAREKLDKAEGDDFRRRAAEFWMEFAQLQDLMMDVRPAAQEKLAELLNLPDELEVRRLVWEQLRSSAFAAMIMEEDNLVHSAEWTFGVEDDTGFQTIGALQDYLSLRAGWYTKERLYKLALDRRRQLANAEPEKYMPDVAMTLNNMGALHANMGHPDEALEYYEEALGIYKEFFLRYPSAYARNFLVVLRGAMGIYERLGMEDKVTECKEMGNMIIKQLFWLRKERNTE